MPAAATAKAKKDFYTYTVEGTKYGEFPLDMLRSDNAKAATPEDQALIDLLTAFGEGKVALPKFVRVTLVTPRNHGDRFPPNVKRWDSFGWRVVESDHPRSYNLSAPRDFIHVDDLRQKYMKKLAQDLVFFRGKVHAGEVAWNAVRYAADHAGQDTIYRAQPIGFLTATAQIVGSGLLPGLLDKADLDALHTALEFARNLMIHQDEKNIRAMCDDGYYTMALRKLSDLRARFA